MDKNLEIELCLWYKMFPDTCCSITCQANMEDSFVKRWGDDYLSFKKYAPKNREERAKFREEFESKYGLHFTFVNGIPRYIDKDGNKY